MGMGMVEAGIVEARRRLAATTVDNPQWAGWVRLLSVALDEAENPAWNDVVPAAQDKPTDSRPLLDGTVVAVEPAIVMRYFGELEHAADAPGIEPGGDANVLALFQAAMANDLARIDRLAVAWNVEQTRLRALGQLLPLPLLQACGRRLRTRVPLTWAQGYCPICGAWPTLAENRGLARERRLRCGRCGSDWATIGLRCPFCDNHDRQTLGLLVPEGQTEGRRVETCRACRGYLKRLMTLGPWKPAEIVVADLLSVELDVAALDQGYARPASPGYRLEIRVVDRPADGATATDGREGA